MEQECKTVFGKKLKDLITKKGVKQKELAERLGKTEPQISGLIKGKDKIGLDELVKISRFLDVSVDYLLGLSQNESTKESIRISVATTGLSEKAIQNIRKLKNSEQYSVASINKLFESLDNLLSNPHGLGALAAVNVYLTSDFDMIIHHPINEDEIGIEDARKAERVPSNDYCIPIYEDDWTSNQMKSCRLSSSLLEHAILSLITSRLSMLRKSLRKESDR